MKSALKWHDLLDSEKKQPYFRQILKTIDKEKSSGITILPPKKDIFNVFRFTEFSDIKVVILGQDPYPNPGQAHGLSFSVRPGIAIPPSLLNIYQELERSISGFIRPHHGYLKSWSCQGVLLLNVILTVRAYQTLSHANLGWEIFTNRVISLINKYCEFIVFFLWGLYAQKKELLIDNRRHYVLKSSHPSPMSAHRGFFGNNHFVLANRWLEKHGKNPINWTLSL